MHCDQARQLFDAYLDGELPPRLSTELGAHRVQCGDCRRALALMEVAGHIVASDDGTPPLREDFSSRLLACVEPRRNRRWAQVRRGLYVAGPLAAAAVIVLAFVGVFDGAPNRVAGEKVEGTIPDADVLFREMGIDRTDSSDLGALERWPERTQQNFDKKRESVESLQETLDITVIQLLEILKQTKTTPPNADHPSGAAAPDPPTAEHASPEAPDGESGDRQ